MSLDVSVELVNWTMNFQAILLSLLLHTHSDTHKAYTGIELSI